MRRSGIFAAVVPGGAAEHAMKDAMELRIAAEASLERSVEHGSALPVAVQIEESLNTPAIAEVNEGEPGLLVKQSAQPACAKSGFTRDVRNWTIGRAVADEAGGTLDGGVNILNGNIAGVLEAIPGKEQSIRESGIEKRLMLCGGKVREEIPKALRVPLGKAAAGFAGEAGLEQRTGRDVDGDVANHPAAEHADPHAEIWSLFNEDVFLCREEPEEVAAADFVTAVAQEVDAATSGDEIQFQLGMSVAAVGGGKVVVLPYPAIQFRRQMQMLTHDKKR